MKKCYVCSPYRGGDKAKNIENVKKYCRDVMWDWMIPIAPHLFFTTFLDDNNSSDRWRGTSMGLALLEECAEIRVYADEVTEGMIAEIKKAQELNIPMKFYNADMEEINYDALIINKRIGAGYRKIIADAHGDSSGAGSCPYAGDCQRAAGDEGHSDGAGNEAGAGESAGKGFWSRIFHKS